MQVDGIMLRGLYSVPSSSAAPRKVKIFVSSLEDYTFLHEHLQPRVLVRIQHARNPRRHMRCRVVSVDLSRRVGANSRGFRARIDLIVAQCIDYY